MIPLLNIYTKRLISEWFRYTLIAIALLLIGRGLFGEADALEVLIAYMGLLFFIMQATQWVAADLNWLMTLPISRKKLLLFKYLFTFLAFVCLGVFLVIIFTFEDWSFLGKGHETVAVSNPGNQLANDVARSMKSDFQSVIPNRPNPLNNLRLVMLALCAIHAGSLFPYNKSWNQKKFDFQWNNQSVRLRLKRLAMVFTLGLPIFFIVTSESAWLSSTAYFFILLGFSSWISSTQFCFPKRTKRIFMISHFSVAALLSLSLLYSGISYWKSNDTEKQVSTLNFFGTTFFRPSRENLVKLYLGTENLNSMRDILKTYRQLYLKDEKIDLKKELGIPIEKFLKTGSSKNLGAAFENFKFTSFRFSELEHTLLTLKDTSNTELKQQFLAILVSDVEVDEKDIIYFLKSEFPYLQTYGLWAARYRGASSLVAVIQKEILKYEDPNRIEALKTLSLYYGRPLTLETLNEFLTGKMKSRPRVHHTVIECDANRVTSTQLLRESDIPTLNQCLRYMALERPKLIETLENRGWISWPLREMDRALIKKIYKAPS